MPQCFFELFEISSFHAQRLRCAESSRMLTAGYFGRAASGPRQLCQAIALLRAVVARRMILRNLDALVGRLQSIGKLVLPVERNESCSQVTGSGCRVDSRPICEGKSLPADNSCD